MGSKLSQNDNFILMYIVFDILNRYKYFFCDLDHNYESDMRNNDSPDSPVTENESIII